MGNSVAFFSLIAWPFLAIFSIKKYGFHLGVLLSIFGSYMLLPAGYEINLPGIPALNKGTVTVVSLSLYMILSGKDFGISKLNIWLKIFLFIFVISPFLTALNNQEQYLHLPGVTLYDGLSQSVANLLIIFPFFIALKYFRSYNDHILLFKFFAISVILYSILILYEIRMSPQLHTMLYGYFPHSFEQQVRAGGYRSVVFVGHGLLIAFLVSIALMVTVSLYKVKDKIIWGNILIWIIFLLFVLVLSKSYAALIFGFAASLLILFFSAKFSTLISLILVLLFISYPALMTINMFPHEGIVDFASIFDVNRAQSLAFRFYNEEFLLSHASEKPFLGWGSWGRNRVYDLDTFQDLSVTDGRWIIVLGTRGWLGFIAEHFFIVLSIVSAAVVIGKRSIATNKEINLLSAHALIVSFILIDQLPNTSISYFYWFFIGALYGRVDQISTDYRTRVSNV